MSCNTEAEARAIIQQALKAKKLHWRAVAELERVTRVGHFVAIGVTKGPHGFSATAFDQYGNPHPYGIFQDAEEAEALARAFRIMAKVDYRMDLLSSPPAILRAC